MEQEEIAYELIRIVIDNITTIMGEEGNSPDEWMNSTFTLWIRLLSFAVALLKEER